MSVSVVNRDDDGVTADVNGDGTIDRLDGLLTYYACAFRQVFELDNDLSPKFPGRDKAQLID